MDDSVPQLTLNSTNENALKQYQEETEVIDENGFKNKKYLCHLQATPFK